MTFGIRTPQTGSVTPSLFADTREEQISAALTDAFEQYARTRGASASLSGRSGRPWRADTEAVYREMWGAFVAYCAPRLMDLPSLSAEDIESYLSSRGGSRDLSTRYAWRLVALIDHVSQHESLTLGAAPNTAARDLLETERYRHANTPEFEPELDYLTARESKSLIAYLTDNARAPDRTAQKKAWTQVRDRTAVALQLGAGLTPGECRMLQLDDVIVAGGDIGGLPWKLSVPANGNYPARETPLAGWAARQLLYWLGIRARQGIAGSMLFPASAAGKPWGRSAVYESGRSVLASAGIASPSGGTYRLRHTFALRQLSRGKSDQEVAGWLGLQDISTIERYRRIVTRPVDDLV